MKVIFLDIDGVLLPIPPGVRPCTLQSRNATASFDNACTRQLAALTEKTGAKLVLSSNWRYIHSESDIVARKNLERQLAGFQLSLWDETPASPRRTPMDRWNEISAWLKLHPETETFCILDDMMLPGFPPERAVLCQASCGLTAEEVCRACELLQHPLSKEEALMYAVSTNNFEG